MDYNTGKLTCKINDNLEYEAISGGYEGYYRYYRSNSNSEFASIFIPEDKWEQEKYWISDNYSHIVGEYEPGDPQKFEPNPRGRECAFAFGRDPEGARLDHMQRPQALMEAEDCAIVSVIGQTKYETPDRGITLYKTFPIEGDKTNYADKDKDIVWTEVPQPCHMQPWIQGRKLVSYEDLRSELIKNLNEYGPGLNCIPPVISIDMIDELIDKCKKGLWDEPKRPDLQRFYVYPKK